MIHTFPQRVLVVGASGPIGRSLVSYLVGQPYTSGDRILLLERCMRAGYSVIARGNVDIRQPRSLAPWLCKEPESVIYLAGVNADTARAQPIVGRELHVNGFGRILEAMEAFRNPSFTVYASSTAAINAQSAYGYQKAEAETLLVESRIAGAALRFPTVLPRGSPRTTTAFLDEAMWQISSRNQYWWPIAADRRVRLMSTTAAALHIVSALSLKIPAHLKVLDLPATIATPRTICIAAGSGCPLIAVQQDIDRSLEARIVDVDSSDAAKLGFPAGESLADLLLTVKSQLNNWYPSGE